MRLTGIAAESRESGDDDGAQGYQEGSAWTQPPKIKHMILDYSDDVELLEVILPAEFRTVELKA